MKVAALDWIHSDNNGEFQDFEWAWRRHVVRVRMDVIWVALKRLHLVPPEQRYAFISLLFPYSKLLEDCTFFLLRIGNYSLTYAS